MFKFTVGVPWFAGPLRKNLSVRDEKIHQTKLILCKLGLCFVFYEYDSRKQNYINEVRMN
jgi:hypothetical protein